MLQNRTWIDPQAEVEFWKQMERLETVNARLSSMGRFTGLIMGGPFRRAALQRDIDAIHAHAQDLVDRHTVLVAPAFETEAAQPAAPASGEDPLRTLAGMVVSLRQDRVAKPEAGEESTA